MLVSLTWRRPLVLVLGVALTYALIATFSPQGAGMLTAYVDHLLGGLAGAAIVLHFSIWPRWRFAWVTVLCVFTLPLIKDAGLFLALMVAAACCVPELATLVARRRTPGAGPARALVRNRLLLMALLFAAPFAASQSWALWVGSHDLIHTVELKGSVSETIGGLIDGDRATSQQKAVRDNIGPALLGRLPDCREKPLPVLVYALGALAALIAVAVTSRDRHRRDAVLLVPTQRYEFELDMLLLYRHLGIGIVEEPIATIYLDNNQSSHFNPILDSAKIYFSLLRFSLASVTAAIIDNGIFIILINLGWAILPGQIASRSAGGFVNYLMIKNFVFFSDEQHQKALPKYIVTVIVLGFFSYGMIVFLSGQFGVSVPLAKILVETIIYLANFLVQRDLIFRTGER
jgi:putative flippase GtrA